MMFIAIFPIAVLKHYTYLNTFKIIMKMSLYVYLGAEKNWGMIQIQSDFY
jgi:hypothetical protein